MASLNESVREMQGLYGPFTIGERVVQKIWLRGDFDGARAVLVDGRPLRVRATGRWNLLGGPDFLGARLVVGGEEIAGDVEVHFRVSDWRAHAHAADPAYDRVVLHVVLFPPDPGEKPAVGHDGRELPALALLPLLHRSLEEHASDDALEGLTARDEWEQLAELAATPPAEVPALLRACAAERWRQKVKFARLRLAKLGWTDAAHHAALEILGYRRNRAAMLAVATRFPLGAWAGGAEAAEIFSTDGIPWQLHGVRPANHPLARLRQYARWTKARPDWPDRLVAALGVLGERRAGKGNDEVLFSGDSGAALPKTRDARQALALAALREKLARDLTGEAVVGSRWDNLVCDGFLPLVCAHTGVSLEEIWFHWFLGDAPVTLRRALTKLAIAGRGAAPHCHGWAQGLLGWLLAREARTSV